MWIWQLSLLPVPCGASGAHAPLLRAPGGTQGPSHPGSHPQSGSRAGLAAPGDLASTLAHAVPPARTGYRLAGQGPGGSWCWVWGLCARKAARTGARHFPGAGWWDGNCAAPSGAMGQQARTNHCPAAGTAAHGLMGSPRCWGTHRKLCHGEKHSWDQVGFALLVPAGTEPCPLWERDWLGTPSWELLC